MTTAGVGNPVLSVIEDVSVVGLIVLAVLVPVLALLAVAVAIVLGVRAAARAVGRRRPLPRTSL